MDSVTALTAVDPLDADHLARTAASVHAAASLFTSRGSRLTWLVVVDGPGRLPKFRTGEHVTMRRLPRPAGPAAALNLALAAAHGRWVLNLGCGEELYAGALVELLTALPATYAWALPAATGHQGGPSSVAHGAVGPYEPGTLTARWMAGREPSPPHLLIRKDLALRAGGFPAVAEHEVAGLALRAAQVAAGGRVGHTVYRDSPAAAPATSAARTEAVVDSRWLLSTLLEHATPATQ